MTPLLPCFLLGIVSTEDRHRNVARDWFLGVIVLNPCRSVSTSLSTTSATARRPVENMLTWVKVCAAVMGNDEKNLVLDGG